MKNVGEPRVVGQFLRFIAAEGIYDVLIFKDGKNDLMGMGINRQ